MSPERRQRAAVVLPHQIAAADIADAPASPTALFRVGRWSIVCAARYVMLHQSLDSMAKVDLGVTAFLRAAAEPNPDGEPLVVPQWRRADWEALFSYTQHVKVSRDNMLIRQNAAERALYFVESGVLEVTSVASGLSLRAIDWFHPGSVVGELSFLDGKPRAAGVCAIVDSELYRLDFQDYQAFADVHPRKACDLVLAIGRLVALRLRHMMSSVEQ